MSMLVNIKDIFMYIVKVKTNAFCMMSRTRINIFTGAAEHIVTVLNLNYI